MSSQKPQPKDKANGPERRDDLALDPETVKDLEPTRDATIRGGGRSGVSGVWEGRSGGIST